MKAERVYKAIAVVGPTASGKSGLAVKLAKECEGEIINADSRQVYKYMNIGTAKDPDDNLQDEAYTVDSVIHHLIDFLEPDQNFSVAEYQELAYKHIKAISKRGKLPFLVGGTGLWVDSICKGYKFVQGEKDNKLREELNAKSTEELFAQLTEINPNKANSLNESDRQNPRRLIRAIEMEVQRIEEDFVENIKVEALYLSPEIDFTALEQRIYSRVDKMFDLGLEDENKKLLDMGFTYDLPAMSGIGYKEFEGYFDGKKTLDEVKEEIKLRTRQYAKRQVTWFKKNKEIKYVEFSKAAEYISDFL